MVSSFTSTSSSRKRPFKEDEYGDNKMLRSESDKRSEVSTVAQQTFSQLQTAYRIRNDKFANLTIQIPATDSKKRYYRPYNRDELPLKKKLRPYQEPDSAYGLGLRPDSEETDWSEIIIENAKPGVMSWWEFDRSHGSYRSSFKPESLETIKEESDEEDDHSHIQRSRPSSGESLDLDRFESKEDDSSADAVLDLVTPSSHSMSELIDSEEDNPTDTILPPVPDDDDHDLDESLSDPPGPEILALDSSFSSFSFGKL